MAYIDVIVAAVRAAKLEAYRERAHAAARSVRALGATRIVECWGDDVPAGKVTDFARAVKAEEDEVVVFAWIEYPSKAVRDAVHQKMMSDPRMESLGQMPFDGKRMIFGGFSPI